MSKQPPTRTHCKHSRPLPYCKPNCRTPRHWKFTQRHRTTRPPPRHLQTVSKYNVGLKTLLLQGLLEPEFYDDLVYTFRKIIGKNDLPYHFKKIIVRYKYLGCGIDVLQQTACLVVNPIKVNRFAYLFNCTTVGRASD